MGAGRSLGGGCSGCGSPSAAACCCRQRRWPGPRAGEGAARGMQGAAGGVPRSPQRQPFAGAALLTLHKKRARRCLRHTSPSLRMCSCRCAAVAVSSVLSVGNAARPTPLCWHAGRHGRHLAGRRCRCARGAAPAAAPLRHGERYQLGRICCSTCHAAALVAECIHARTCCNGTLLQSHSQTHCK